MIKSKMSTDTANANKVRINNALSYIEDNLLAKLSLEEIAQSAHYSKYHFTRMFSAITGETLRSYIQKRRISESSMDLLKTKDPILNIAMKYRFESQEAYTRSFQSVFGISPGVYRRKGHKQAAFDRYKLSKNQSNQIENYQTPEPRIEVIADKILIGMRTTTCLAKFAAPTLWQAFMPRRGEVKKRTNDSYLSVQIYYDEMAYEDFSPSTAFDYMAAVEVEELKEIPHGMEDHLLKGGKFAVFLHKGPMHTFQKTLNCIYGTWLINSSHELDHRDHFEILGAKYYGPHHPDSEEEVWVPLV